MNYSEAVDRLFTKQWRDWSLAYDNYETLTNASTKRLQLGDAMIVLQHNPARRRSSAAKLDAASIEQRKCFLCTENQPTRQRALLWGDHYKIQVNPYPIFPKHLTIADQRHLPQSIGHRLEDMMQLAYSLPFFVIFYNGPRCGASAPDHMHFQAGSKGILPLCSEISGTTTILLADGDEGFIGYIGSLGRSLFTIETTTIRTAQHYFKHLMTLLPQGEHDNEPMVNVLCWWDMVDHAWRLVVFPRSKQRPSCYGEGPNQLLLSPAAVEMGGLWAVPEDKDFNSLTAERVQALYDELCLSRSELEPLMKSFSFNWNEMDLPLN